MKAVDSASDTAAEGWDAQAARCPPAGEPGPRVEDMPPLDLGPGPAEGPAPEPEARRGFRTGPARADSDRPALSPAAVRAGGIADRDRRARPSVNEGVLDAPIGQDFQGLVEGVALANAPEVQLERHRPPSLRGRAPDFEAGARSGELERGRPGPAPVFYQSPDIDIKGAAGILPDLLGQAQAFVGFDADRHGLPRPEAVEPPDVARRIETAEEPFNAVDFPEHGPGGLAGIRLLVPPDEDLEKCRHGVMREAVHGRPVRGHHPLRGMMSRSAKTTAATSAARAAYLWASRRGIWAPKWRYGSMESRAVAMRTSPAAANAQNRPVRR